MPTDDERRDVAAKLRCFDFLSAMRIGLARGGVSTGTLQVLGAIVGVDMTSPIECAQLFDRLADLIEPSCDRDALLELADEMKLKAQEYVERFDENSSTADALNGYAGRIREALCCEKTERQLQG